MTPFLRKLLKEELARAKYLRRAGLIGMNRYVKQGEYEYADGCLQTVIEFDTRIANLEAEMERKKI